MVGGFTDWLDGKLARLLNQYSTLGALLDPAVDRLYILAALVALGVRDVVPWWAVAVLVGPRPRAGRLPAGAAGPRATARSGSPTWARARRSCCSTRSRCCCSAPATAAVAAVARPLGLRLRRVGDRPVPLLGLRSTWRSSCWRCARARGPRTVAGDRPAVVGSLRHDSRRPALHRRPRVGARRRPTAWCGSGSPTTRSSSSATSCSSSCRPSATRSRSATPCGEVESTKSVSEIYAPVAGEVVAVNEALADEPGAGELRSPTATAGCSSSGRPTAAQLDGLLDAAAYDRLTDED